MDEVFEYCGNYIVVTIYKHNEQFFFSTCTTDNIGYIFFSNENKEELIDNKGIYDTFEECLSAAKDFWKNNEYVEKEFMEL